MSARVNAATLVAAIKQLNVDWELTKAHWTDAKSRQFEEEYMADVPSHVAQTCAVIGEIDVLLRKVRSDCE